MIPLYLAALLMAPQPPKRSVESLTKAVAESGRVLTIAAPLSERLQPVARIAPGAPPLLSFRLFEGKIRHRYGSLDLVMDDAGH